MSVAIIARRAGVSIATVSRVLNNSPRVNPHTARLVREAAQQINYDPTKVRRGPRLGGRAASERKTLTLGVIAIGRRQSESWLSRSPLYNAVIASITRAAGESGARVVMDEVIEPDTTCETLRQRTLDGAIVFVRHGSDPALLAGVSAAVPVVRVMGEHSTYPEIDLIRPDNSAIGQRAFRYLHEQGCRRLGYVMSWPEMELAVSRGLGFSLAATAAGIPARIFMARAQTRHWPAGCPVTSFETLDEVGDIIAADEPRIDGLFLSGDSEAIGMYPVLERRDIVPGRDIKIIACNNDENGLAMLNPRPATFDIGTEQLGSLAVSRLIHRIAHPHEPPLRILVTPRLVAAPAAAVNSQL